MTKRLQIELDTEKIKLGGEILKLTKIQTAVLLKLANPVGKTFTQDEIIEGVWGYNYADRHGVQRIISVLRSRLDGAKEDYIITLPGIGYCLNERNTVSDSELRSPHSSTIPEHISFLLKQMDHHKIVFFNLLESLEARYPVLKTRVDDIGWTFRDYILGRNPSPDYSTMYIWLKLYLNNETPIITE
jgi:DNA-binding winged helix-turn-helix (wHTH) protein